MGRPAGRSKLLLRSGGEAEVLLLRGEAKAPQVLQRSGEAEVQLLRGEARVPLLMPLLRRGERTEAPVPLWGGCPRTSQSYPVPL